MLLSPNNLQTTFSSGPLFAAKQFANDLFLVSDVARSQGSDICAHLIEANAKAANAATHFAPLFIDARCATARINDPYSSTSHHQEIGKLTPGMAIPTATDRSAEATLDESFSSRR